MVASPGTGNQAHFQPGNSANPVTQFGAGPTLASRPEIRGMIPALISLVIFTQSPKEGLLFRRGFPRVCVKID
jgi:hypothetical protein